VHPLRSARVVVEPSARTLTLDAGDGVRSWALRLGVDERSLVLSDVRFVPGEGEDGGASEDEAASAAPTDALAGAAMDVDEPPAEPKPRRRGRPPKVKEPPPLPSPALPAKLNGVKVKRRPPPPPPPAVQVRLNGIEVGKAEEEGWMIRPTAGILNVVELGSHGGMIWKVYVQTS
jgi:hypothetical protein